MYAETRGEAVSISTAVGLDGTGGRRRLSLQAIAETDDPLIAESAVDDAVRRGQADALCAEIASRVPDGIERVEVVARTKDRDDLALAQHRHLAHHLVTPAGDIRIRGEMREDVVGCLAHGHPGVGVRLGQEVTQLGQQQFVVGEDHVVLAAELAEERRPRDARRLGDLLDGGRLESLLEEQVDRSRDDGGAVRPCGNGGFAHDTQSLVPRGPDDGGRSRAVSRRCSSGPGGGLTGRMTSLWKPPSTRSPARRSNPGRGTTSSSVGAGITGLSTALMLARAGMDVAVVEAGGRQPRHRRQHRKALAPAGTVLSTLRRHHPAALVRAYVDANREGAEWLTSFADGRGCPTRADRLHVCPVGRGGRDVEAESAAGPRPVWCARRVMPDAGPRSRSWPRSRSRTRSRSILRRSHSHWPVPSSPRAGPCIPGPA